MNEPSSISQLTLEWLDQASRSCLKCGAFCPPNQGCDACGSPEGAGEVACPNCRYPLRQIREARCPECGEGFELGMRSIRRFDKLFISGLSILGLSVGVPLGLSMMFFGVVLFDPDQTLVARNIRFIQLAIAELLVGGMLLYGWIAGRRQIRRWPWLLRLGLVLSFAGLGIVAFMLITRRL